MNKYQEAIAIRNAYIQIESGTKCLDDFYKEKFDTLQEACEKADKYDKLADLFKSYNVYNYNELENILKNRGNNQLTLSIEDLYTIIRSINSLDSNLTLPNYEDIIKVINQSKQEYQNNIK